MGTLRRGRLGGDGLFDRSGEVKGLTRRDGAVLAVLSGLPLLLFGAVYLSGRTFYYADLTYLHHPWRALAAEMLQRGMAPLWDPYAYMGMPLAANLQNSAFYPGTVLFHLFGFSSGLALFHILHYALNGVFMFLWLRSLGLRRCASAGGAAAYMLGGELVSALPFLNYLPVMAMLPAMLLFSRSPALLALAMSSAFLCGYPPKFLGACVAAFLIASAFAWGRARPASRRVRDAWGSLTRRGRLLGLHALRWAAAGILAAGISACLLLPGLELASGSQRGRGVEAEAALIWSYRPEDLVQFTAPPLIPDEEYSPYSLWWKTSYWGIAVWCAALAGLAALPAAGAAAALAYLAAVLLVVLGGTNPASRWLWLNLPGLDLVRYPGNMAYLAAPVAALLAAYGLSRWRHARVGALVIACELLCYLWGAHPTAPRGFYKDAGPLVRTLRRELGGGRYMLSPLALQHVRGHGPSRSAALADFKHRLYGVSNLPSHLASASNLGDPMAPRRSYDFMDHLMSLPGVGEAARWMGWAGIRILLTRDRMPSGPLEYLGDSVWHMYRNPGPVSMAYWFDEETGARIPEGIAQPPPLSKGRPLRMERPREDRFAVSGTSVRPGWLYVAQPLWPGWEIVLESEGSPPRGLKPARALGAFMKMRVPEGRWTVRFLYDPASWRLGVLLSTLFVCGLAGYWYNRFRRKSAR